MLQLLPGENTLQFYDYQIRVVMKCETDGKSVYLQLVPCWETNQENMAVTDPAEGPGQRGPQELEGFFPYCHLTPQVKEVKSLLWVFSFSFWLHFFRNQI